MLKGISSRSVRKYLWHTNRSYFLLGSDVLLRNCVEFTHLHASSSSLQAYPSLHVGIRLTDITFLIPVTLCRGRHGHSLSSLLLYAINYTLHIFIGSLVYFTTGKINMIHFITENFSDALQLQRTDPPCKHLRIRRIPSSVMWRRMAPVRIDVSEQRTSSFIRAKRINKLGNKLAVSITANFVTNLLILVDLMM
jgi:hypothetical protein